MFLALNIFCAFLCWSMAKKRGRRPFRWFVLGFFFPVFAVIALFFKGNQQVAGAQMVPLPSVPSPAPAPRPAHAPTVVQRGQVDLNALRAAVRMVPRQDEPSRFTQEEEQERRDFMALVESSAPALDFSGQTPATTTALRQVWVNLGRILAESGCAGGVDGDGNFYETGDSGTAVEFYPVSLDGTPGSIRIQFALAMKEFQGKPQGLEQWVSARFHDNFGDPVLFGDPAGRHFTLLCAGVVEPSGVVSSNLDELCDIVRNQASVVKRDLPLRFGGLWL